MHVRVIYHELDRELNLEINLFKKFGELKIFSFSLFLFMKIIYRSIIYFGNI